MSEDSERKAVDDGDEPDVEGHMLDTGEGERGYIDSGEGERGHIDSGEGERSAADTGEL